jgi:hypothetical protein
MRNYVLRVIASFENETKRNVITCNFQLNETGETTIKGYFPQYKPPIFTSWIGIRHNVT